MCFFLFIQISRYIEIRSNFRIGMIVVHKNVFPFSRESVIKYHDHRIIILSYIICSKYLRIVQKYLIIYIIITIIIFVYKKKKKNTVHDLCFAISRLLFFFYHSLIKILDR